MRVGPLGGLFLLTFLGLSRFQFLAMAHIFKRSHCTAKRYEFWPSDLHCAGHTSVLLEEGQPLWKQLEKTEKHEIYGIHMVRMQKLPCKLIPSSKFRNAPFITDAMARRSKSLKLRRIEDLRSQ